MVDYKISKDKNIAKMQKEYFAKTGRLLGTEPAGVELKRLRGSQTIDRRANKYKK